MGSNDKKRRWFEKKGPQLGRGRKKGISQTAFPNPTKVHTSRIKKNSREGVLELGRVVLGGGM